MIRGTMTFDGIAVMEFDCSLVGSSHRLSAKAAFVNSATGITHGSTTCTQWSQETLDKLKELRAAMEQDLGAMHCGDSVTSTSGPSLEVALRKGADPGGLGENLRDEAGTPQT